MLKMKRKKKTIQQRQKKLTVKLEEAIKLARMSLVS